MIDNKGNIQNKLGDFGYTDHHNNVVLNKNYILDRIDGSMISNKFSKETNRKATISTNDSNAIKWIGITIGKSTSDRNFLRGKLYQKSDHIKFY
jgi:hypothetical protein